MMRSVRAVCRSGLRTRISIVVLWLTLLLASVPAVLVNTASPASAADTGFKTPSSYADIPGRDSFDHPGYGRISDDAWSYADTATHSQSYYGYGFSIPAGATIDGIVVTIEGHVVTTRDRTFDVSLSYDGGTNWTAKKNTGRLTAIDATYTLGEASDRWGFASWTPAVINSSSFRVRLDVTAADPGYICLDALWVRVYYHDATTTTVTSSLNPTIYGNPVTFTATVSRSGGSSTPSGAVDFRDGGTSIGTGTLSGSGGTATAIFTTSSLSAGVHSITAVYSGNTMFAGSSGTLNGGQTVIQKALTITATSRSKTYGDTATFAGTEFTVVGLVNADTVNSVTLTSNGAAATATVAGSPYDIEPSAAAGSGLANYSINYARGSLTVTQKALTITATSRSKMYGDTVTFTGTEFTIAGLVNADKVDSVTLSSNGAADTATVAGSPYDIETSAAAGSGLANYSINYARGSLTVTQKPLTITAMSRSKTYGDTVTFSGTEFSVVGLANADTVNGVTLSSNGAADTATVAGSPYDIEPSAALGSGLANYSINYARGSLTVIRKPLTVTATDGSKTYGDTVTFTGTEFSTLGLVNADTVNSVTLTSNGAAATATIAASPYDIEASAAAGSGLANYEISYLRGTLTVSTRNLTITAADCGKTYGDSVTFTGTEFSTLGLVNADAVNGVTLTSNGAVASATVAGGPYDIEASAAIGSGLANYEISYLHGTMTISPKNLTITAADRNKTYGDTVTFAGTEFTVVGLINADGVTSVALTSTGADASAPPGSYSIVPKAAEGTGLANYGITYVNGTLIVKKALSIIADGCSKTYGDSVTFAGIEFTVIGLEEGDSVSTVTLISGGADANAPAGAWDIVPSVAVGTGLGNYGITYVSGTLTVNPKPLVITAENRIKTYGDSVTFAGTEFSTMGLVNSDNVTGVTLSSDGASALAPAWTYDIVPSEATGSCVPNYAITYFSGTLTVNPRDLMVTANNRDKLCGTTVTFAGTEFAAVGLVNADSVASVTLTSAGAGASAATGQYDIVPSAAVGTGLTNYNIAYSNGTLTVGKASVNWDITASPASSTPGSAVTFTATVTGTAPTGTVTFRDGEVTLGSATLRNGTATYTTSALSPGSHSITVSYDGDENYAGGTSLAFVHTVETSSQTNWGLIGGVIAAVVAAVSLSWLLFRRVANPFGSHKQS